MNFTNSIRFLIVASAVLLASTARAQTTVLANFDTAPVLGAPGNDLDPQFDNVATCSGCWYSRTTASGVTYSRSTTNGVTQGTGALSTTIVGKGAGGEYTYPINGSPAPLDTHFDYPMVVTYSNNPAANGGVLDPRFTAIKAAVDSGNQAKYTIDFDIVYDVAQMRSIAWQAPEETVDPETNGQYPQRYFWVGMYGNANEADGFQFLGFDQNTINPFDAAYDTNLFPVFNASFPLTAFTFLPDSATNVYTLGILYNSVFGTLPAASNTVGAVVYFDNFRLVEFDPTPLIDFNNNSMADVGDWELFMAQHLVPNPTLGDLVGNFGAVGTNGANDRFDLLKFEEYYDLINGGGSLAAALAGVPEPGSIALWLIAGVGMFLSRRWRAVRPFAIAAVAVAGISAQSTAQAQLVEGFDTIGRWVANTGGAAPGANPSVALTATGATQGATALKVTQAEDTIGDGDFSWNAITGPNWTTGDAAFAALQNAVNIGAEHFNLLADVTFNPDELINQGVNSMTVWIGLNFNAQTIGIYSGETEQFTTTATLPLSAFNLGDVEDQGVTNYGAQIAFVADGLQFPFSANIDNIRLEQISTPDLLTLEVDRSDGSAVLKNLTTNPISWDYMEIKSVGGSLDAAGWSGLDEQDIDGAGTWLAAGGSSANALVEFSLNGSHTLAPSATIDLGFLYNEGINAEDVDLEIRRVGGPVIRTYDQLVTYVGVAPEGVAGDYNNNGVVDAADYTIWRDHLNASFQLQNEGGISPGVVDAADYNFWKSRFGANSGSGGLAAVGAVPEPSALWLGFCAALAATALRPSRID